MGISGSSNLVLIKSLHTTIWVAFNIIIFYIVYAVIVDRIDRWVWIGIGCVLLEALVLASNRLICPLTTLAERYTENREPNFDIYLPLWLAKYNKIIYTGIFGVALIGLAYRLLKV